MGEINRENMYTLAAQMLEVKREEDVKEQEKYLQKILKEIEEQAVLGRFSLTIEFPYLCNFLLQSLSKRGFEVSPFRVYRSDKNLYRIYWL